MSEKEAIYILNKSLPNRKIVDVSRYRNGYKIVAVDKSMPNDDYSGSVFYIDNKGELSKLSVIDMLLMD